MLVIFSNKAHFLRLTIFTFIATFVIGCSTTKRLSENQKLLTENTIIDPDSDISEDEILPILKQQPNRKIGFLFIKGYFHLWMYNRPNPERMEKFTTKRDAWFVEKNKKIELINKERTTEYEAKLAQGDTTKLKIKKYKERGRTWGEWFQSIGEAPVILDSIKTAESKRQIQIFFINKGYYNCKVTDSVYFSEKNPKKAQVKYFIKANKPYTIDCINKEIASEDIKRIVNAITKKKGSVKVGNRIDIDLLNDERNRIATALIDSGYYYFNKDYIYFEIDTTIGNRKVDLYMGIHNIRQKVQDVDTIYEIPHKKYKISNIYIRTNYNSKEKNSKYDTIQYKNIDYLYNGKLKFKSKLLDRSLLFREGQLYSSTKKSNTFKKYSQLGVFKNVAINYKIDPTRYNSLNSYINLTPAKSQTFTIESDGTHSDGLLGIKGSIIYAHRNLFGGAEELKISMSGGLEAQNSVVANSDDQDLISTFNTIEFGPKVSLTLPKYLFLDKFFPNHTNSKTQISASVNFQRRPDYNRGIEDITWAWIFHEKKQRTIRIDFAEISAVEIGNESDEFLNRINSLNDKQLAASYQDHIISASRITYVYNGQEMNSLKNVFYVKASLEGAGNMLRSASKLLGRQQDSLGSYEIINIRFAQYIKAQLDVRYYKNITKGSQVAYRIFGGLGIPLANLSEALPFEKSFYAGGASGNRAWKARTLGPGSYNDPDKTFDKIGDIMLESNIEVRFDLIDWIEGAAFVDAGNIWQYNDDPIRPGGQFDFSRFYKEIAFGGGLGLRMDLSFFLIRFDFAMPLKNPALPDGNRWVFGNYNTYKDDFKVQFNLGIGYPF